MGISKFMILLIVFTILFLFIEKKYLVQPIQKETKPTVTFFDSTMYEISELRVNQILKSKQADIYKNKEHLIEATIVLKVDKNNYEANIASGKNIVKMGDKVFLTDNVNVQLANGINLKTEKLNFDLETQIVNNNQSFVITRNGDTFMGNNLFLNTKTEHLSSENTKFRMKVEHNE